MTKTKKKDFNNVLFDIVGWVIMGLSIWKVFFVLPEITIKDALPYAGVFIFGAACVAYTIKGVVDIGRNKMKK
jgi:hypothetical protein